MNLTQADTNSTLTWLSYLMGTESWKYNLMNSLEVLVQALAVILLIRVIYLTKHSIQQAEQNNNEILRRMRYAAIDELYFDINKIAIEHPRIRQPATLASEDQDRYATFSLMTYNFIETIYDTVNEVSESENLPFEKVDLWNTWNVIAKAESVRHKDWLLSGTNIENFKSEFLAFLRKNYIPELS